MNRKESINKKMLRYVYILEVDNRGKKSKFRGQKRIYYTGQTNDILRRFKQHLNHSNSKFLTYNFYNAIKKIVYVGYIYGTEYDSLQREQEIKKKNKIYKDKLIQSEQNKLVAYVPCKCIILKNYEGTGEICLKF